MAGVPHSYDWAALHALSLSWDGLGGWREARWDGFCRGCGLRYAAGEPIRWYAGEDGWLGTCCG